MPVVVDMICLANSRKHSGRCVAGLLTRSFEGVGDGWIRPVGNNDLRVLMERHYTFADGREAAPLDLIRLELDRPDAKPHHPEDWMVSPKRWELLARPAPKEIAVPLLRAHLARGSVLGNVGGRVAYADCVVRAQTPQAQKSLGLVWGQDVCWAVSKSGTWGTVRKTRAVFTHGGATYDLPMTDPDWEHDLNHLPAGPPGNGELYPLSSTQSGRVQDDDRVLLTVSLSEPLDGEKAVGAKSGWCYKMAAGVVVLPREWRG